MPALHTIQFSLFPQDNERLQNLCGWHHEHIDQVELRLGIEINSRGFDFAVTGLSDRLVKAEQFIRDLYELTESETLTPEKIHLSLHELGMDQAKTLDSEQVLVKTRRKTIKTRNPNQASYIEAIKSHDVNFGIGQPVPEKLIWR